MLVREFESDDESVENCNKGVECEVLVLLTLSGGKLFSGGILLFYCN